MADEYFNMRKAGGEMIEGVHQDAVKDHERLGYRLVVEPAPSQAEKPAPDESEREQALERFTSALNAARKKPGSAQARFFESLGVDIMDPPGPAEPWPPHVLMANTIDALAQVEPEKQATLIATLFGKSSDYAQHLVDERSA